MGPVAVRAPGAPFGPWRDVASADWDDWRWQLRNRLTTTEQLARLLPLGDATKAWMASGGAFQVGITPYFASLFDQTALLAGEPAHCPLLRQVLPDSAEARIAPFERADPLGEDRHRTVPGIVHKYPDRVLLLVTDTCAAYCRYCTRARWVASGQASLDSTEIDAALQYIEGDRRIVDVLISGGDPLLWSTARLGRLVDRLADIDHLHFVRIGTRVPVFLPMRVDAALVHALRPRRIPVFVNVHINHHRELGAATGNALGRLADGGVPLGGQTVLLRGVNDDPAVLRDTFYAMLSARVRPYYLFHCDPVRGTEHLRTSVDRALAIVRQLVGHCSGMAVPKYCIDLEGGGKVPLWPDYVERVAGDALVVRGFAGEPFSYDNRSSGGA